MTVKEAERFVLSQSPELRAVIGDIIESAMAAEQRGTRAFKEEWLALSHWARQSEGKAIRSIMIRGVIDL